MFLFKDNFIGNEILFYKKQSLHTTRREACHFLFWSVLFIYFFNYLLKFFDTLYQLYIFIHMFYTAKKDSNADVIKYNQLLLFSFYYSKCTYGSNMTVGDGWNAYTLGQ